MECNQYGRIAKIQRDTKETKINCALNIDGHGASDVDTGVGFFDHMLQLLAFHSGMNLEIEAIGDLGVCDHHTIEDVGITLGKCFNMALGDKKGINRYGFMSLPMDESLAQVTLDISGRSFLVYNCELKREKVGEMSCEMVEEFLRAFAFNAGITLHVQVPYGTNDHHKIEAIFKGLGRALNMATKIIGNELPSSKGVL
ncbi:imidazoleglycerol-phosphate dehydratase [Hathewaya proteolytica DSM 3090]|uniref:Imidazoleglycerol-phosphate dehydratase n=1 Tax=Hathewaya proteolytica DSM 3090 TaxID=1121331 RepID=A0A1M6RGR9_9CLOT|nr:imidazoleglycerol-phosphate dehydratase HisB [Hathewaya proteolytica]SHK31681.1 imidazoleglycerol-phosphate dehydratase [Hathewaya proteolytica DSM 3090]